MNKALSSKFLEVTYYDRHQKKTRGYNSQNVITTTKIRTLVKTNQWIIMIINKIVIWISMFRFESKNEMMQKNHNRFAYDYFEKK